MAKTTITATAMYLIPALLMTSATAQPVAGAPTTDELRLLIQASWPSFSRLIQTRDRLIDPPTRLTGLPQAMCRLESAQVYECVSLLEYQLTNGRQRSGFVQSHVSRDAQGRLTDVIFIRETPTQASTEGVR